jgi:eukaryotic-like serine/threonine-protein kinase
MDRGRWRRLGEILLAAVERPTAEREAFLDRACGAETSMRRELEALLRAHEAAGAFLASPADLAEAAVAGTPPEGRLGPYRLLRELGRGGTATVLLGVRGDGRPAPKVAVKLLRREWRSAALVERFEEERQILAGLNHPNIARLLAGGATDDGRPYLVLEYVQGEPIDRYCDRRRLTLDHRVRLFLQVGSAVEYSHDRGVVHLDLKPDNILVGRDGVPRLLDFGIARLLGGTVGPARATAGLRLMTLAYASPEQVRGEAVTPASDLYSLGVLLYKLLTGHSPYRLGNRRPGTVARAVERQRPERPSLAVRRTRRDSRGDLQTPRRISEARGIGAGALARRLTGDLDRIALRALEKDPRRRYASVRALAAALRRCQEGLDAPSRAAGGARS